MNSIYDNAIGRYARSRNWPKKFCYEIRENEEFGYLQFVVFRDNFESFDGEDKWQIANMIKEVMEKVRADGIPIYMEVKAGNGLGSGLAN